MIVAVDRLLETLDLGGRLESDLGEVISENVTRTEGLGPAPGERQCDHQQMPDPLTVRVLLGKRLERSDDDLLAPDALFEAVKLLNRIMDVYK